MQQSLLMFNRGRVDPLALARVDQKRVAISADVMTNFIPRVLGPMSLRPGWEYITATNSNLQARYLPFIFSVSDAALIELTNVTMRVVIDDVVLTRPAVTAAVTDGTFVDGTSTDAAWPDTFDEAGATSAWDATSGHLGFTGNGTQFAIREQEVTVNEAGTEHALRITINRGPVKLRVGSATGTDDYISETTLEDGIHSLAFTPTGNFFIRFMSNLEQLVLVASCVLESSGIVTLTTPWSTSDLDNIRYDQSGDVVFVACKDIQQRRIERRAARSWSVVTYKPDDGPFRTENITATTLTPSALTGNITLTSSVDYFKSTNVGSLFSLTSTGQEVTANVTGDTNTFTSAIKVTGINEGRIFSIQLTASDWTGASTITLQRSLVSATGPWADVAGKTWTAASTSTFDDGLDNLIVWYQIGCKTGDYTPTDDIDCTLDYPSGSITGVTRVTGYTSSTVVSAEVLTDLGGTEATEVWSESIWSTRRGWPSAVKLHEGRLWWAGKDKIIGSISDGYDLFDPEFEGDAGPINRTIGIGPVDSISWLMGLQRLVMGGEGSEFAIRSSSFDEPLTPFDFQIRIASTQGSAAVDPVQIDQRGLYVQRGGVKIYELNFDSQASTDYDSNDITLLVPEMGCPGLTRLGVQRQQDTRIHAIRSDGTVMMGVYDKAEDVLAWVDLETDGEVEDVVILPGDVEDTVYYSVKRTINGGTVRYLEKWAQETDCRGGDVNKQADSFKTYSSVGSATLTGLSHLEGEEVVVWADGADVGTTSTYAQTYTVTGGQIVLAASVTNAVVGLPYTAQFKSAKLAAQGEQVVEALTYKKRIDRLGLIMGWAHPKGLRFGPDFDHLDPMPLVEGGITIDVDTVRESYSEDPIVFPGRWLVDKRLCLQAQAPRPVTVMAAVPDIDVGG